MRAVSSARRRLFEEPEQAAVGASRAALVVGLPHVVVGEWLDIGRGI